MELEHCNRSSCTQIIDALKARVWELETMLASTISACFSEATIVERDRYREALENSMLAIDGILAIARSEDCACGNEGCTETADAWEELESAGREAHKILNP